MAMLRSEVEKLVAARETDFLSRVVQESSTTAVEMVHRAAEQEAERIQLAVDTLAAQFRHELAAQFARQTAAAEQRLREIESQLSASGEKRFEAISTKAVERLNQDAKRLSESAIAQWHKTFEQSLQTLPDLVRENLKRPATEVGATRR